MASSNGNDLSPDERAAALAQLAPDKLVMQSIAALGSVRQQISLVGGRLDELRQAKVGASPYGVVGAQKRSLTSGPPPTPTAAPAPRSAAVAPPPSAAAAPAPSTAAAPPPPSPVPTPPAPAPAAAGAAGAGGGAEQPIVAAPDAAAALPSPPADEAAPAAAEETTGPGLGAGAAFPSTDLGLYIRVEGDRGEIHPTDFDPGFSSRSAGMTVGADYKISTRAVVGAALSYTDNRSELDTSDGTPGGEVNTRGAGVSLYGAFYPTATTYVDATLVYGRNRYESTRNIAIPTVVTDAAIGSSHSEQYGVSLGAGYSLLVSNFNLGPYVRVSSSKVKVDAFTEQANSSDTQLAVQAQTAESVVSVLGGQIAYAISRNWGVLVPNVRFEWEHQYKDDRTSNVLANFSAATSNPAIINIETTPADRNYFNLGVGLASHFGVGRSAFIYYQTVLGKAETTNHAITAELRLEF
ncbi:MAG: autotransporter outer membrane beta-barrel domain-containing protein [Burkholderiaceae bacterium]|nr:autotransporter outer membrane beta-barrel domain-containing protein [Burkholderiaceae bacterium]